MAEIRKFPDQYLLRLPGGLRDRIAYHAELSGRSMNAEIIHTLEDKYPAPLPYRRAIEELDFLLKELERHPGSDRERIKVTEYIARIRESLEDKRRKKDDEEAE